MKTERRHNLETNELARHMAEWINKVKPHSNKLLVLVGVFAGLLLVSSLWSAQAASKERTAWDAFALAINTTDLELMQLHRVAEEHPNTTMQEWAYATWADRQLQLATQNYLLDRDAAKDRLRRVTGYYEALIADATDPQVRSRAHLGLGRIHEMQNKLEAARAEYALVEGDLAPLAEERAKQLESAEVQAACEWLATAELPKPTPPSGPGTPGERPGFEAAEPATTGKGGMGGDALKTIEELLKGSGAIGETDEADDDRYDEKTDDGDDAASSETPAEQ